MEGEEGNPVRDVIIEEIVSSWNFSRLSIPPLFLDYGTYKFSYTLQLLASKIFPLFKTVNTYVKVRLG